jgi:hypothetical protein
MNKISTSIQLLALAIAITALHSCKPDPKVSTQNDFGNGAFVVEQGQYLNGTGTISYINKNNSEITKDVFSKKNNGALGNILQSMNIINGTAYLVVNNANKIVACNANNMAFKSTITGVKQPRYIKQINDQKAYISEWGDSTADGAIRVMDLETMVINKRIRVGNGAEQIAVFGNRAYVTCNGGFGNSDSIAIINIEYDTLIGKIAIGANPESMVQDADNNIWILCKGQWNSTYSALAKTGSIVRYNTFSNTIDRNIPFASTMAQPTSLCINGAKNKMYYSYNGGCWFLNTNETVLHPWPVIYGNFYGINIDPKSDVIYTLDAKDYSSNGLLRRYNTTGTIIDSFGVGILPSEVYFTK